MFDFDGIKPDEFEATDRTVVAFRQKYRVSNGHRLPEDTMAVLKKVDSTDPAMRPLVTEVLSDAQVEKWRTEFVGMFGDKNTANRVADKLLGNLRRIDQNEFEEKLMASFRQASEHIKNEDLSKAGFVYYSGGKRRSNEWVREIGRDYVHNDKVLDLPLLDYYDKGQRKQCDVGIIMDDASYSGQQVTDHIKRGHELYGMKKFYVIVPFMTEKAMLDTQKLASDLGIEVQMFVQEKMPSTKEVLGEADFKWLRSASPYHRFNEEQTLTYFSHKIPDYRSFCPYIGNTRHVEVDSRLDSLIVQRPAVYHAEYRQDLKARGLIY